MAEHSQFQLLRERRFAPFFWTQFLGAGNDNASTRTRWSSSSRFQAATLTAIVVQRPGQHRRRGLHRAVRAVLGDRRASSRTSTRNRG